MRIKTDFAPGQFVRSYSPGIWQIYRVLTYIDRDPRSGSEQRRTSVFSKRFVTNAFKRSFRTECCNLASVEKLDEATTQELAEFIDRNKTLYRSFCEYWPKPVDAIYNARIKIPGGKTVEEVEALLSNSRSLNVLEIDEHLTSAGLETGGPRCWTVQYVSKDHECRDGWLAYRFHKALAM